MISLAKKLQDLESFLDSQYDKDVGYGRALIVAIVNEDLFIEVEVLKCIGDLHLQKGKQSKDSVEFDKAAALYAAALLRCTDPNIGQTLEHRIGYMEKLCSQLLQGYSPNFLWLSQDYWGTIDSNVLRVAEICGKMERRVDENWWLSEDVYTETLLSAIANGDIMLEVEVLKSLGDFYLEEGRRNLNVSQFSKATTMYNKALKIGEEPETKETLHHRMRYTEKISQVTRKQLERNKPSTRERTPNVGRHSENVRGTDVIQDHHLHADTPSKTTRIRRRSEEERRMESQYKGYLEKGESSLARADLDSAEQHFAAALKTVHVRDSTAQQYQREVEPLCKLGDVYRKRGQRTGDGGDFVKAAALYNAAIARSKDEVLRGKMVTSLKEVEKSFLTFTLGCYSDACLDDNDKHKKQLKEMRDQIKLEMETIDQQLDPYVDDEDDPCVKDIEANRAQAVRQLFERISQERKEFISQLVEECIGLMGPPPCKYALIGLGSQATGLVTPYSDLEFAILVEEESEQCLEYFRKLTHYLHLKVVNLGETILPALAIKSLNDFYSLDPLDNWYYDSVTPRGFAFDGSMPKASKTPLGRQGTMDKPPSELICTPNSMVSILKDDIALYLKEGYHLASILRNPCLIAGDKDLINAYTAITFKVLQSDGGTIAQKLVEETIRENVSVLDEKKNITARLIDVKKYVYRFPALAVDCLALSSGIIPTTVWETIEDMENQHVISPNNAHHLTVLTSISAELRLRTYIANGGQKENLSALVSIKTALDGQGSSQQAYDEVQTDVIKVFHLPNEKQLFRYYYTAIPLKRVLSEWSENKAVSKPWSEFFDTSPRVRGMMHSELCKYRLAVNYYHEALTKADDIADKVIMRSYLADACCKVGDYQNATVYNEQALQLYRTIFGERPVHPHIANSLNNQGEVWYQRGDYKKAMRYFEDALQMYMAHYGPSAAHHHIAGTLNNLGHLWSHLGDHGKAISYHEQAQQMYRSIYGKTTAHPGTANSLNNIGLAWTYHGDDRNAIKYYEQALQMYSSIYGQGTIHPLVAMSLCNLGSAWHSLADYRKAIGYYEIALQMRKTIYGTAHPDISTALSNLGLAWNDLGGHQKAISYHGQALEMYKRAYGQTTAHAHIAKSMNNLGEVWNNLGDYRKAIAYHEQALQMYKNVYGQGTPHSDTAASHNNLGAAWYHLSDHMRSIKHYEEALGMYRSIHGQATAHADIVTALNNLGETWGTLGNHRKAVVYLEKALHMLKTIHGHHTAHPDIAGVLNNLGEELHQLSDYKKAVCLHEQALQMRESIYDPVTAHPEIAVSLHNLGDVWGALGDHRKAIMYLERALQMYTCVYGQTAHSLIANSLNSLGAAWRGLGDHQKGLGYYDQALKMRMAIYGATTAHSDIAASLSNLGEVWGDLGNQRNSISYLEQALQMHRTIYGQTTAHPEIATFLDNLGGAWSRQGDYRKALDYYEQALQMRESIYGKGAVHSDIAASLNNVAGAWNNLGEHRKAAKFLEHALHTYESIYGDGIAHPHILMVLNNMGWTWGQLGDYRKAISYHERALQMGRDIYGQSPTHPDIAMSINNLALACLSLGDYGKAISEFQNALQMYRSIYGQDTAHHDIALSLNNLGVAWYKSGDYRTAINVCKEALAMARKLYLETDSHPLLKQIEKNIAKISAEHANTTEENHIQ
ncbi:uncharacterized protein LOC118430833 [Branchiostoma floridae]|uniref:Uncharacterized protein LOC118430833 n=1 Tax=Branchiostoma floridae TaxID=7739 RepID=A0A9J7MBA9_BRAFL|nr:uncharacterized protein LOC118430833 [Branchiostoma floridae]